MLEGGDSTCVPKTESEPDPRLASRTQSSLEEAQRPAERSDTRSRNQVQGLEWLRS
jgi:hypothetical protein